MQVLDPHSAPSLGAAMAARYVRRQGVAYVLLALKAADMLMTKEPQTLCAFLPMRSRADNEMMLRHCQGDEDDLRSSDEESDSEDDLGEGEMASSVHHALYCFSHLVRCSTLLIALGDETATGFLLCHAGHDAKSKTTFVHVVAVLSPGGIQWREGTLDQKASCTGADL